MGGGRIRRGVQEAVPKLGEGSGRVGFGAQQHSYAGAGVKARGDGLKRQTRPAEPSRVQRGALFRSPVDCREDRGPFRWIRGYPQ